MDIMERQEAIQYIKSNIPCDSCLNPSKGQDMYNCPFCGSGEGKNHTGALKLYIDTNTFTCHACGRSGDIFDLQAKIIHGVDDVKPIFNEVLSELAEIAGIEIDAYRPPKRTEAPQKGETVEKVVSIGDGKEKPTEAKSEAHNYIDYYKKCRERLSDPAAVDYLTKRRGISIDTASSYWLGYDPAWQSPTVVRRGKNPPKTPRIIIPTSESHYIARDIRADIPEKQQQYSKMNEGSPSIFNVDALYAPEVQEVFVVEGAIDALSIIEAGYSAIALNSTSNIDTLLKRLENQRTTATLILCLDNDEAGRKATKKIRDGVERLNIQFITADICNGCKDPNEALVKDRESFIDAVSKAKRETASKPDSTDFYIDALMAADIESFKTDIKTGFENLDKKAGGLYAGLYCLAAISSLGKTSFALQMADNIAAAGNDVIFFSLEQSRLELVSKSIARFTAQADMMQGVTSLSIRKGYLPEHVLKAANDYKASVGDRLSIVEGNFDFNISFIRDYIARFMKRNPNSRPVVILDYLQIIQPDESKRQTTKEAIDTTITGLKQISRNSKLPIIAISSVNRTNYLTPIDFESLKESGGIEYSCDVVWGLQLQCLNEDLFNSSKDIKQKRERVKKAKAETPRKIELVALKNRFGVSSFECHYDYYPANDLFIVDAGYENKTEREAWREEIKRRGRGGSK